MNDNHKGAFALALVVIGIVALWVWDATGGTIPGAENLVNDVWTTRPQSLFEPVDNQVYHNAPTDMIKNPCLTQHRYPLFPGNNITLLIHRGFSPLMDKAGCNPQWYDNPPANMAGYSL